MAPKTRMLTFVMAAALGLYGMVGAPMQSAQAVWGVGCSTYAPPNCGGWCLLWEAGSCAVNNYYQTVNGQQVLQVNCQCGGVVIGAN